LAHNNYIYATLTTMGLRLILFKKNKLINSPDRAFEKDIKYLKRNIDIALVGLGIMRALELL